MPLRFVKYHGLGNDFILVEGPLMEAERAIRLCDRRRGIGADGVLTLLPAREGGVAFMHITNSDGSVAKMCGNGIRCVARHLAETRGLGDEILIETEVGPKRCRIHRGPKGRIEAISVDMGPARLEGEQDFEVGTGQLHAIRVSMGNPHAVVFGEASRDRALLLGPAVEAKVPGGINVGFASPRAGAIDLVVWERGAGLTEACGTGACAATVAAIRTGKLEAGKPVSVHLPGGTLEITVSSDLRDVEMRGPAERVFEGETEM
jgi:diaminopimelate epimerase